VTTLGIDIGGSGIKGALVDTERGELVTDRLRIATPDPATPEAVIETVREIVRHFNYRGPLGVGLPSVVVEGVVLSAANINDAWIGFPGQRRIGEATGCDTLLLNDADAAGIAEMRFGAGQRHDGVVMIFTLGTGIGSAIFVGGQLVPNTELGHLYLRKMKKDAEDYAANRIRKKKDLSWKKWGRRLDRYFRHIEDIFSPQLIVIGGGVSKKHEKFIDRIETSAPLVPAQQRNEAGIIGAALAARGVCVVRGS
jgi:polyphosphate glucokinase